MNGNGNYAIAHHGIKGQRWGVRRFQNEDGSLTSAGRKRYDVNEDGTMIKKASYRKKQAIRGTIKTVIGGKMLLKSVPHLAKAYTKYKEGKKTGIIAPFKRGALSKQVLATAIGAAVVGAAAINFVKAVGGRPVNSVGKGGTPESFKGTAKTRKQVLATKAREKNKK